MSDIDISPEAVERFIANHHDLSPGTREMLRALRSALTASEKLAAYGAAVLDAHREDFGDLDGGFLQDKAVDVGVLVEVRVEQACDGVGCHCAEYGEFPQSCYRYEPGVQAYLESK